MNSSETERQAEAGSLQDHAGALIALAERAIDHGLVHGRPPAVRLEDWPEPLHCERATFVTLLDSSGALRGCIGSIEARQALVEDVSANAFAAAFRDPRFAPLAAHERPGVRCRLSVLTPRERIRFEDETDLVRQLRPGRDGVLIESKDHRGTLLPAVWEQLPDPFEFWQTVRAKAGLAAGSLPPDVAVYRYEAESIG